MNKVFNIMKKIFSISLTEDFLRYRIILFGIKISFPRPVVLIRKISNPFYKYKKEGRDITTLPKATGQVRDIQLANLAILIEIDKVCKNNDIKYWIDYGNLLGAVRHRGYIPWDDDIDISMLREDFDKFVSLFEDKVSNKDLYLKHMCNKGSYLLKVCHKKCKYLFVDVFIYDYCNGGMNDEEKIRYTEELEEKRSEFLKNITFENGQELYDKYKQLRNDVQKDLDFNNPDNDLMYYIEFGHQPYIRNNWVMNKNDILPLQEIKYEGLNLPTVSDPHNHLVEIFGKNYMGYPRKIDFGHGAYAQLSKSDKAVIKELIKGIGE